MINPNIQYIQSLLADWETNLSNEKINAQTINIQSFKNFYSNRDIEQLRDRYITNLLNTGNRIIDTSNENRDHSLKLKIIKELVVDYLNEASTSNFPPTEYEKVFELFMSIDGYYNKFNPVVRPKPVVQPNPQPVVQPNPPPFYDRDGAVYRSQNPPINNANVNFAWQNGFLQAKPWVSAKRDLLICNFRIIQPKQVHLLEFQDDTPNFVATLYASYLQKTNCENRKDMIIDVDLIMGGDRMRGIGGVDQIKMGAATAITIVNRPNYISLTNEEKSSLYNFRAFVLGIFIKEQPNCALSSADYENCLRIFGRLLENEEKLPTSRKNILNYRDFLLQAGPPPHTQVVQENNAPIINMQAVQTNITSPKKGDFVVARNSTTAATKWNYSVYEVEDTEEPQEDGDDCMLSLNNMGESTPFEKSIREILFNTEKVDREFKLPNVEGIVHQITGGYIIPNAAIKEEFVDELDSYIIDAMAIINKLNPFNKHTKIAGQYMNQLKNLLSSDQAVPFHDIVNGLSYIESMIQLPILEILQQESNLKNKKITIISQLFGGEESTLTFSDWYSIAMDPLFNKIKHRFFRIAQMVVEHQRQPQVNPQPEPQVQVQVQVNPQPAPTKIYLRADLQENFERNVKNLTRYPIYGLTKENSVVVPFVHLTNQIWLANDSIREILMNGGSLEQINELHDTQADLFEINPPNKKMMLNLPNVIISLNGKTDRNSQSIQKFESINHAGIQHLQYPISEMNPNDYERFLTQDLLNLMQQIDEAINEGKTILIHCNQGEHRSAAVSVLYLATRAGISFEEAHQLVSIQRPHIKPYNDNHQTLMTEAYQWWQRNFR